MNLKQLKIVRNVSGTLAGLVGLYHIYLQNISEQDVLPSDTLIALILCFIYFIAAQKVKKLKKGAAND